MIKFNGETFSSEKDWAAAYPAYGRHYASLVTAGCDTVMKLEQEIHARREASRKGGKIAARTKNARAAMEGIARFGRKP